MTQHSSLGTHHLLEQKRPVWLIIAACFMMLYQIVWLIRVLQLPDNLKNTIRLSVPLEIIASILIVTFITYGIRALILKKQWSISYTMGAIMIQIGYALFRLVAFADADYDRQRLPFLVILYTVVCGLWMLPKLLKYIHQSTKGEELV